MEQYNISLIEVNESRIEMVDEIIKADDLFHVFAV
jgi:hypothetical protein